LKSIAEIAENSRSEQARAFDKKEDDEASLSSLPSNLRTSMSSSFEDEDEDEMDLEIDLFCILHRSNEQR
jgi:hypothetical protein